MNVEYPGCISIEIEETSMQAWFGFSNETWGASVNELDGDMWVPVEDESGYIETHIPVSESNHRIVAAGITLWATGVSEEVFVDALVRGMKETI